ncbi:MAG: hypothetical protein IKA10_02885 [Oscillospiraceae bacterium]|nr:hypothetical protein [Oscillospiraceae bacterium]
MNIMMKKILSLFLAFTIIFSVPPVSAYAAETDSSDFIITSDKIINPMYQQYANQVSSKKSKLLSDAPAVYGVIKNFTDAKKAGVYLRNQLKARNNEISFQFTIPYHSNYEDTLYAALETIINEAVRHTGVPNEGDYINFQWISSEYDTEGPYLQDNNNYVYVIWTFYPQYFSTAAQEKQVNAKVNELKDYWLDRQGGFDTHYMTVYAIYEYMTDNIVYDYLNDNSMEPAVNSAYSALINGSSNCHGFALLFYRIALEYGVDCRLIQSNDDDYYCWNIVKVGNKYYNIDAAWDSYLKQDLGYSEYEWFLLCDDTFVEKGGNRHIRYETFDTAEFNSQYPMSTTDFDPDTYVPAPELGGGIDAATGCPLIRWSSIENVSKYQVYRSTTGKKGSFKVVCTTSKTQWLDKTVTPGQKYYYKLKAIYNDGTTSEFSMCGVDTALLPQPKNVTAANVTSSGKIKLTWDKVSGAVKYEIWRSRTGKTGSFAKIYTTTSTSYVNTNAESGTLYYYKVKAVHSNTAANSEFSKTVSRRCTLPQVTNIKTTNVAKSGKIKLTWNKVDGAVKYEIWRSKTGKDGSFAKIFTTTNTSYINTSAQAGTLYYYKVKAVHSNSNANGPFSAIVKQTCDLAKPEVTISLNAKGKPTLKWAKVDGAAKYEIWRSKTGKDSSFGKIYTVAGTATTYTNKLAEKGTLYYYKVKAVYTNTAANSAFSTPVNIRSK